MLYSRAIIWCAPRGTGDACDSPCGMPAVRGDGARRENRIESNKCSRQETVRTLYKGSPSGVHMVGNAPKSNSDV